MRLAHLRSIREGSRNTKHSLSVVASSPSVPRNVSSGRVLGRGIPHKTCAGVLRPSGEAFLPPPPSNFRKTKSSLPSAQRDQTNNVSKQINRIAQHRRHHPVALDAQISKVKLKTEV